MFTMDQIDFLSKIDKKYPFSDVVDAYCEKFGEPNYNLILHYYDNKKDIEKVLNDCINEDMSFEDKMMELNTEEEVYF